MTNGIPITEFVTGPKAKFPLNDEDLEAIERDMALPITASPADLAEHGQMELITVSPRTDGLVAFSAIIEDIDILTPASAIALFLALDDPDGIRRIIASAFAAEWPADVLEDHPQIAARLAPYLP